MKEADEIVVAESANNVFPEGTTMTVRWYNVNQFTGRISMKAKVHSDDIPNRVAQPIISFGKNPDDSYWTESIVGIDRPNGEIKFEEVN